MSIESLICAAIKEKQQLQFLYNSKLRIIEPQLLGIGKKGHMQLRGYQLNETPQLEKLFDLDKIKDVQTLPVRFSKPGPHYNPNDSAFKEIICRL